MFDDDKKEYLNALFKPDFSKKGNVDEHIFDLINSINKLPDYVTTSSCSGRIMLIVVPNNAKKHQCDWPFVTHDVAKADEAWKILNEVVLKTEDDVWFKMESAIFHVQCRTMEGAQKFIDMCKLIGIKRSGIFVTKPERFIIETIYTEKIETIVAKDGKVLVSREYFDVLVNEANRKLVKNHSKLNELLESVKKM